MERKPMWKIPGMCWKSIKNNPSVIPMWMCCIIGGAICAGYVWRQALLHPDASFNKRGNPHPWLGYENKQYKMYSTFDYKTLETPKERPKLD